MLTIVNYMLYIVIDKCKFLIFAPHLSECLAKGLRDIRLKRGFVFYTDFRHSLLRACFSVPPVCQTDRKGDCFFQPVRGTSPHFAPSRRIK